MIKKFCFYENNNNNLDQIWKKYWMERSFIKSEIEQEFFMWKMLLQEISFLWKYQEFVKKYKNIDEMIKI